MVVNPLSEEILPDVWPEPLLAQSDSVCLCPVTGCLWEEADSHLAAASLGLCQVCRLLLHMWRVKLVSFCTDWWMQYGHGPSWVWIQLTIMMHAIKTWHFWSTDRLPNLPWLWDWVCPLPWDTCHLPEPHQHWCKSRGGCRHYQQTTSTLFPTQLSGPWEQEAQNFPQSKILARCWTHASLSSGICLCC